MKVSVVFQDKTIAVDGVGKYVAEVSPDSPNHRGFQWKLDSGYIDVYSGDRLALTDISQVQKYIDMWENAPDVVTAPPPVEPPPPPPGPVTSEDVNAERLSREALTLVALGHPWRHTSDAKGNIQTAGTSARFAIEINGAAPGDYRWLNPDEDFEWVDINNEIVKLDAYQMASLAASSGAWVAANADAAQALAAMDPIPEDYKADKYWPSQLIPPPQTVPPAQVSMSSLRSILIEADEDDEIEAKIKCITGKRGKWLRHIWNGGGQVSLRGKFAEFLRSDMGYTAERIRKLFKDAKGFVA